MSKHEQMAGLLDAMKDPSRRSTKKILVMGNGPSLKPEHFSLVDAIDTLGMNAAYRYWQRIDWYPTLYCCLDDQVVLSHADAIRTLITERRCRSFFLHPNILQTYPDLGTHSEIVFLPQRLFGEKHATACTNLGLTHEPSDFFRTSFGAKLTTGSYAVRFAASLGYDDIGLIGIDCRYKEKIDEAESVEGNVLKVARNPTRNPNYFFDDYQQEGDIYNVPNPTVHNGNLHLQSFEGLRIDFERHKLRTSIRVCTKESELTTQRVFEYCQLEQFTGAARLSAVFMPFVKADILRIIERFETWGTTGFTPYSDGASTPRVALHLAFNQSEDLEMETALSDAFEKAALTRFFTRIHFEYSNLSGLRDLYARGSDGPVGPDGYMAGPNNQFLDIIQKFSYGMSHIALIESDVAPLRAGWLKKLEEIVERSDRFWICGSHYRGIGDVKSLWHVNGNAIYNVGDPEFRTFIDKIFIPRLKQRIKISAHTPYDIVLHDIFRSIFAEQKTPELRQLWSDCAHRIRFADFVVDLSHAEDRKPENLLDIEATRARFPEAWLIHGAVSRVDRAILGRQPDLKHAPRASTSAPSKAPDVILIDPDATDWFGHYMAYNDNLTRALERLEHTVSVICNADLLAPICEARPHFLPRFTVKSARIGKDLNNSDAIATFEKELEAALDDAGANSATLYMYCGSFGHAEAIARILRVRPRLKAVINLFYESFSECDTPDWNNRWAQAARKLDVLSDRLRITVPTARLQARLASVIDTQYEIAPHPSTGLHDEEVTPNIERIRSEERSGSSPFQILFPGSARRGKGFEDGLHAANQLATLADVQMVVRCPHEDEAARFKGLIDNLPNSVKVVAGSLGNDEYLALYRESEISVLLYDPKAFAKRTSGLLIDSIYNGLPVVTLKDSWLGDVVERFDCGIALKECSPASVVEAVARIRADYAAYRERALGAAALYFQSNSWRSLALSIMERKRPSAACRIGRRMLIIGNGPSTARLAELGFDKIPADVDTFGMGAAYRHFARVGWWPTYFALADSKVVHSHRDALKSIVEDPSVPTQRFYFPLRLSDNFRLSTIPHSSTGDFCLRRSVELGYTDIYLLGIEGNYVEEIAQSRPLTEQEFVDLGFSDLNLPPAWRKLLIVTRTPESNPNYFFDDYQQAGDVYSLPQAKIHRDGWSQMASQSFIGDRRIYNLSDRSVIKEFPFLSLDDFLQSTPEDVRAVDSLQSSSRERARAEHAHVDETAVVAHLLQARRGRAHIMLDVGAHHGSSAECFRALDWTVHCFEPDAANREKLEKRFGKDAAVTIDPRAVSDKPATRISFFTSNESTGISGLSAFRSTHKESARVDVTTLTEITKKRRLNHVDFLKIDVEGFDFAVLKGVPWDCLRPDVIECEFEDAKTVPMGHNWRDIAKFLLSHGYAVYLSEWHPIVRYGIRHDWRRVVPLDHADIAPGGWGNILAFREDPGFTRLSEAFERKLQKNPPAKRTPDAAVPIKAPSTPPPFPNVVEQVSFDGMQHQPSLRFYAPFANDLKERAPSLFTLLRFGKQVAASLWRRRLFAMPASIMFAAWMVLGFLVEDLSGWIWIIGALGFLFSTLVYLALRVSQFVERTGRDNLLLRQQLDDVSRKLLSVDDRVAKLARDAGKIATMEAQSRKTVAELQSLQKRLEAAKKASAESLIKIGDQLSRVNTRLDASAKGLQSEITKTQNESQQAVAALRAEITSAKEILTERIARTDRTATFNNANWYQRFNRRLTQQHMDTLKRWARGTPLKASSQALGYAAHRACMVEARMRGRLAGSIEDILLRTFAGMSVPSASLNVLEIGSLFGVSAGIMYDLMAPHYESLNFTLIDPLDGYYDSERLDILTGQPVSEATLRKNLAEVGLSGDNLTLIKLLSTDEEALRRASERQYDVLVIDGDHSLSGIRADFELYMPMVRRGGIIIFDDYDQPDWPDVKKFVDTEVEPMDVVSRVGNDWRTCVYRKVRSSGRLSDG